MQQATLLSLRLGFSAKQASKIKELGASAFIQKSIDYKYSNSKLLNTLPANLYEVIQQLKKIDTLPTADQLDAKSKLILNFDDLKYSWLDLMYKTEFPLREKMTLFWHNHFVSTQKNVRLYYLHKQNQLFRKHAFGNFKELCKLVLKDEAMLVYLNNNQNKIGKVNENLSRELLELFTLGIGNYTETDIQQGAKALCGLYPSDKGVRYIPKQEDNSIKKYLGKTGNLKVDDLVDAIFEHPKMGFLVIEKLLKYFITDTPSEASIAKYAKMFRSLNFEITPLLKKIFEDSDFYKLEGAKIKDPIVFIFQSLNELNYIDLEATGLVNYLKFQGMDLFNQVNVKGWQGGHDWLNTNILMHRFKSIDYLLYINSVNKKVQEKNPNLCKISYNKKSKSNTEVIQDLANKLIYKIPAELQSEAEEILTYDFYKDPSNNLNNTLIRVMELIMKSPIYQLI